MRVRGVAHSFSLSLLAFFLWQGGKYVDVPMVQVDQTWVSAACKKNPSCEALAARARKPLAEIPKHVGLAGHPANDRCLALGAKARILKDSDRNQWNFCLFSDGSMIDSWALYGAEKAGK